MIYLTQQETNSLRCTTILDSSTHVVIEFLKDIHNYYVRPSMSFSNERYVKYDFFIDTGSVTSSLETIQLSQYGTYEFNIYSMSISESIDVSTYGTKVYEGLAIVNFETDSIQEYIPTQSEYYYDIK